MSASTPDAPNNGSLNSAGTPPREAWRATGDALLADDDVSVRGIAAWALQKVGLTVSTCDDGQQAVDLFAAAPDRWSLVVLDLTMPKVGGADALLRMQALRPEVRALLYSGYTEREIRGKIDVSGRVGFLQKPFTARTLSDAVRRIFESD